MMTVLSNLLQRAKERVHQQQVGELSSKLVDLISNRKEQVSSDNSKKLESTSFIERIMIKERGANILYQSRRY